MSLCSTNRPLPVWPPCICVSRSASAAIRAEGGRTSQRRRSCTTERSEKMVESVAGLLDKSSCSAQALVVTKCTNSRVINIGHTLLSLYDLDV
jgi:hypothetical protein